MWNLKRKTYKRGFQRGQFRRPTPAARKGVSASFVRALTVTCSDLWAHGVRAWTWGAALGPQGCPESSPAPRYSDPSPLKCQGDADYSDPGRLLASQAAPPPRVPGGPASPLPGRLSPQGLLRGRQSPWGTPAQPHKARPQEPLSQMRFRRFHRV